MIILFLWVGLSYMTPAALGRIERIVRFIVTKTYPFAFATVTLLNIPDDRGAAA